MVILNVDYKKGTKKEKYVLCGKGAKIPINKVGNIQRTVTDSKSTLDKGRKKKEGKTKKCVQE